VRLTFEAWRGRPWIGPALAAVLCHGCSRAEPTARLIGQVTVDGKPHERAVMVVVENRARGVSVAAVVDAGGRFDVLTAPGRGIPEGRYQVGLMPTPAPVGDIAASLGPETAPPATAGPIPEQFQSPATSGLTVDVQLPETRFDIAIPSSK
jgi:hypothetical protein